MIYYPNCKINLGLRVIDRREDGYHTIETVFVPVYALHDELEVTPADAFSFVQQGLVVDCPAEENLIVRCYRQMAARYPQIRPVAVRFRKNIPFGAGLGGGSSDAAHMAIALNDLFGLGLSREQLAAEVRSLGADCPFFIYNTACFAEGIGDILTPVSLDLSRFRILLVKPTESVSTREAYAGIVLHPEAAGKLMACLTHPDIPALLQKETPVINDFEQTVFPLHPAIAKIKQRMLDAGAVYASMSGSGSTVFGLFENNPESSSYSRLGMLEQEFASMVLLNDSLGQWKA